MNDDCLSSLLDDLLERYDSFDPDYEAYLWIDGDGHGKRGAPYHIKDIVTDMEAAEDMIWSLYCALRDELQK